MFIEFRLGDEYGRQVSAEMALNTIDQIFSDFRVKNASDDRWFVAGIYSRHDFAFLVIRCSFDKLDADALRKSVTDALKLTRYYK
jgi:hypothetical protein